MRLNVKSLNNSELLSIFEGVTEEVMKRISILLNSKASQCVQEERLLITVDINSAHRDDIVSNDEFVMVTIHGQMNSKLFDEDMMDSTIKKVVIQNDKSKLLYSLVGDVQSMELNIPRGKKQPPKYVANVKHITNKTGFVLSQAEEDLIRKGSRYPIKLLALLRFGIVPVNHKKFEQGITRVRSLQ